MYTIDRLNLLRDHYGLSPLKPERLTRTTDVNNKVVNPKPAHHFINILDSKAGIDTRGYAGATVGARLRIHEWHMGLEPFDHHYEQHTLSDGRQMIVMRSCKTFHTQTSPPYYHWLGAAA